MGKHTLSTYKIRSIKSKFSGVRYVHKITASTKGITIGETIDVGKSSFFYKSEEILYFLKI